MMTTGPEDPTRVLLLRTGEREMTAVSVGRPTPAWLPLAGTVFSAVAPQLLTPDGVPAETASVRSFTMRAEDLKRWDSLHRHGEGGYSYGTLWDDKGIRKNVQIKEVSPSAQSAAGLPPIDPVALATAAAVAQIQADIQRLAALLERVWLDVKAILQFLHLGQEAEVLAATETIGQIYARYRSELRVGSTDWERLIGLEQVLKTQHRQIIGELDAIADTLRFTTVKEAKAAERISAERVQSLIHLEWYLLCSLEQWGVMMLAAKANRGENSLSAANEIRRLGKHYLSDARTVLLKIKKADSVMAGRGIWEKLFSDGLVLGTKQDNDADREACARRAEVRALPAVRKRLPAPIGPTPLRLAPERTSPAAAVAAATA